MALDITPLMSESDKETSLIVESQAQPLPGSLTQETVLSVKHWTDHLFSFRITRPRTFRFRSGEFIMLGMFVNNKPLLRAYSVTSPNWDEELEFLSIKVQGGPLTSKLQHIKPGDKLLLGKKPTGTLTLDAITPAKNLYMISTGTGIAPFVSLIRDPETFEKFQEVVLTHTCRTVAELEYGKSIIASLKNDPLIAEFAEDKITYFSSVTQDNYNSVGRITTLINSGEFFRNIGKLPLMPKTDRVMICGSVDMLKEVSALVEASGFIEGSNASPADFIVEKAFAE
jgi:ferredoxin--NADP+ reductase